MEIAEIFFDELPPDDDGGKGQDENKNTTTRLRRVKTPEGEGARFLLGDVVKLMGLKSNVTTVGNRLDERDVFREEILTGGGTQTMISVNVMGLLQTVLGARCKSQEAKRLHQWIRHNILRSIDLFVENDDDRQQTKKKKATKKKKKSTKHSPPTSEDEEEEDNNLLLMAITFEKGYDQKAAANFAREYQEEHPDRVLQASVYVVSRDAEDEEGGFPVFDASSLTPLPPERSKKRQGKRKQQQQQQKDPSEKQRQQEEENQQQQPRETRTRG